MESTAHTFHTYRHSASVDIKSLIYALLVHGLVLVVLIANLYLPGNRPPPQPGIINARVVMNQSSAPTVQPQQKAKPASSPAPTIKEQQQKAEALAKQQAIAKKKKLAAEKARKAAAVKKKKLAAEHQRREQAKKDIQRALAAEEKERAAQANEAKAMAAMSQFEGLIRERVTRNWIRPLGVPDGLNCLVHVRLAAGGQVLSVSIVKSSGNALFDRSVENAVYKAAPLPVPDDPQLFQYVREINIKFDPQDQ